jgi:hypothetical protein
MAYKTEELEKKALAAAKRHKLMFIEHIVAYLPCSKETFYNHKLHESDAIKKIIDSNRIGRKSKMLGKWIDSESNALQIAAMKLIATEEEAHRLSGTKTEIKHKGGIESTLIEWKPAE